MEKKNKLQQYFLFVSVPECWGWQVCVCVQVCVPADAVVLRCVQSPLQLSAQPQGVRVFGRVGVVEEENHQQEEHVNQEVLTKDKTKTFSANKRPTPPTASGCFGVETHLQHGVQQVDLARLLSVLSQSEAVRRPHPVHALHHPLHLRELHQHVLVLLAQAAHAHGVVSGLANHLRYAGRSFGQGSKLRELFQTVN